MTREEFEAYKKQDKRLDKGRLTYSERRAHEEAYYQLTPQQKAAMTRLANQRAVDEERAEYSEAWIHA